MKNYKQLIRLIIITAALVACGVFACKFMRTQKNTQLAHQIEQLNDTSLNQVHNENLQQDSQRADDNVIIQKSSSANSSTNSSSKSCIQSGFPCSSTVPCCSKVCQVVNQAGSVPGGTCQA